MIQERKTLRAGQSHAKRMFLSRQQTLLDFLVNKAIPENPEGFTLDPRTLSFPPFGSHTYIVSLNGHEKRFSVIPTRNEVFSWVTRNYEALMAPGHYVGSWLNKSIAALVFDVSVPIQGVLEAQIFGRKNGQESIYHPASNRTIYLIHDIGESAA